MLVINACNFVKKLSFYLAQEERGNRNINLNIHKLILI